MIVENIKQVEENIKQACEKVGRNPEEVTLIAVSKTKPYTAIEEALPSRIWTMVKIKYRNSAARWSSFHQISAGI